MSRYRDEYGPCGILQNYTFDAKTPLQNPNGIRVPGVVLFVIACVPLCPATLSGFAMPGIIYAGLAFLGAAGAGVWAFIIAGRRQRWPIAKGVPRNIRIQGSIPIVFAAAFAGFAVWFLATGPEQQGMHEIKS